MFWVSVDVTATSWGLAPIIEDSLLFTETSRSSQFLSFQPKTPFYDHSFINLFT